MISKILPVVLAADDAGMIDVDLQSLREMTDAMASFCVINRNKR